MAQSLSGGKEPGDVAFDGVLREGMMDAQMREAINGAFRAAWVATGKAGGNDILGLNVGFEPDPLVNHPSWRMVNRVLHALCTAEKIAWRGHRES